MARVSYRTEGNGPFRKILMHSPDLATAWDFMLNAIQKKTSLPADLREQVRATLAADRGCKH